MSSELAERKRRLLSDKLLLLVSLQQLEHYKGSEQLNRVYRYASFSPPSSCNSSPFPTPSAPPPVHPLMLAIRRILPVEVQAVILSYLAPSTSRAAVLLPARTTLPSARFSSTASLAVAFPYSSTAAPPSTASLESSTNFLSVFEDATEEYDQIPLSTLDNPPVPRTPQQLLLSHLHANRHSDALSLLHDLQASSTPILPRYLFANYAFSLLRADVRDPSWMEWWALAPSLTDARVDPRLRTHLRAADKKTSVAAREALATLLKGTREGTVELDRFVAFSELLARQGYAKVVAEGALRHVAAYGTIEQSEQLFATTMTAVRREQDLSWLSSGSERIDETTDSRRKKRVRRYFMRTASTRRAVTARKAERTRRWFAARTSEASLAVLRARATMVLAHANLGRLDEATHLVLSLPLQIAQDGPIPLTPRLHHKLLDLTARRNRYDLFKALFDSLHASGRKLVRVRNARLKMPTPYLVRGAKYEAATNDLPSVGEAFTAFRYQHVGTSFGEEGLFESSSTSSLSPSAARGGEDRQPAFGEAPSVEQLETLRSTIQADDPVASLQVFLELVKHDQLPPAPTSASWLVYALAKEAAHPVVGEGLAYLENVSEAGGAFGTYWTTVKMLAYVTAGRHAAALGEYAKRYDVVALPEEVREAVVESGGGSSLIAIGGRDKAPPSAYTFAILVQALVPLLEPSRNSTSRLKKAGVVSSSSPSNSAASAVPADPPAAQLEAVYRALVDAERLDIIPSFLPSSSSSSSGAEQPITSPPAYHPSPLSPYTFIPFLRAHLRLQSPPLVLLSLLADMTRLGIQSRLPHYAIVLNSFARFGDSPSKERVSIPFNASYGSNDLLYLLECFAARSTSTPAVLELAARASPAVVALLEGERGLVALPPRGVAGELNARVYTGVLAGLRKRGERDVALRVLEGVVATRKGDVERWGTEDKIFRGEVVKLTGWKGKGKDDERDV